MLLLFDDNKIRMARKPGKKLKKNPVRCTRESNCLGGDVIEYINISQGSV